MSIKLYYVGDYVGVANDIKLVKQLGKYVLQAASVHRARLCIRDCILTCTCYALSARWADLEINGFCLQTKCKRSIASTIRRSEFYFSLMAVRAPMPLLVAVQH